MKDVVIMVVFVQILRVNVSFMCGQYIDYVVKHFMKHAKRSKVMKGITQRKIPGQFM